MVIGGVQGAVVKDERARAVRECHCRTSRLLCSLDLEAVGVHSRDCTLCLFVYKKRAEIRYNWLWLSRKKKLLLKKYKFSDVTWWWLDGVSLAKWRQREDTARWRWKARNTGTTPVPASVPPKLIIPLSARLTGRRSRKPHLILFQVASLSESDNTQIWAYDCSLRLAAGV